MSLISPGGIVARISSSTALKICSVVSMRVPVVARTCRRNCPASTVGKKSRPTQGNARSEEHTSELQSPCNLVCRLLLEKKKKTTPRPSIEDRHRSAQDQR